MTTPLDPAELFRRLSRAHVDYILIGGLAVNAHGVIRSTKDIDICPDPAPANLRRLAKLLRDLNAHQLGIDDEGLREDEMPFDPMRPDDLAQGGNFRLATSLGVLDIMQWIPGIEADSAYATLRGDAEVASAFGVEITVCSLHALRLMKRAAGRAQDLRDLADLDQAHPHSGRGDR